MKNLNRNKDIQVFDCCAELNNAVGLSALHIIENSVGITPVFQQLGVGHYRINFQTNIIDEITKASVTTGMPNTDGLVTAGFLAPSAIDVVTTDYFGVAQDLAVWVGIRVSINNNAQVINDI